VQAVRQALQARRVLLVVMVVSAATLHLAHSSLHLAVVAARVAIFQHWPRAAAAAVVLGVLAKQEHRRAVRGEPLLSQQALLVDRVAVVLLL
jgi:hypothetical protein